MNYYIIADTHFGHEKMHAYCGRPIGYEDTILKNVFSTVTKEDILIHLGDFCIYKDEYWHDMFMKSCIAKKWLIRGNHDRKSLGWYYSHGWDFVADMVEVKIFGKSIALSHKPINTDSVDINIHGHLHNVKHHPECDTNSKNVLVFIEHNYSPINMRKLVECA